MADKTYYVTLGDRAGELGTHGFVLFEDALAFYRVKRPGIVATMAASGCEADGDTWYDGLSEDERDQL